MWRLPVRFPDRDGVFDDQYWDELLPSESAYHVMHLKLHRMSTWDLHATAPDDGSQRPLKAAILQRAMPSHFINSATYSVLVRKGFRRSGRSTTDLIAMDAMEQ